MVRPVVQDPRYVFLKQRMGGGGGSLVDYIRGCSKVYGCFFVILGIPMGGLFAQPNAPNLKNWV